MEPWSRHKDLRYDPDNLITLCDECHKAYHNEYHARQANSENFIEWFRTRKGKYERDRG
jgi:5-methylcytosine-specific restriction endonuclease McrA